MTQSPAQQRPRPTLDIATIRDEFPILSRRVNGRPLVYLDSGATAQKPAVVIDTIDRYYRDQNANIHRGVHHLSQVATIAYEEARETIARWINAGSSRQVLFTRGTTESINLVASSWGRSNLGSGDEIIISTMEHHSNIVPWQMVCEERGATLRIIPVFDNGELDQEAYRRDCFTDRTRHGGDHPCVQLPSAPSIPCTGNHSTSPMMRRRIGAVGWCPGAAPYAG